MSWLMIKTSTAIFGSYSWDSLREVLWDVCSLVWFPACRHRHDSSGGLQVVTSMLQASTIWYFNASGSEDLVTLPGIQDRHNNVVPDESSSKQNLGQNFIAIFGILMSDCLCLPSASWIPFLAKHAEFWLIGPAETWESVMSLQIQFISQGKNPEKHRFNMIETSKNFRES